MYRASSRRLAGLLFTCFALAAALVAVTASQAYALPPTLSVPGSQTVAEFQTLSFTVTATDPEGQTCFLYASNMPSGATFTDNGNNTGSFAWTPDGYSAGYYDVYFTANDTFGGITTKDVPITVTNASSPPVLNPIADRTLDPGSMAFISVMGSDPDGDPLTLTQSGLPPFGSLTDFGDGTGSIALQPSASQAAGTWPVTVYLSDGTTTVSQSFTVTVTGAVVAHPPVLAPIASQTVAEGATVTVAVSATDQDGGTLTWTLALPGFATLVPGTSTSGSLTATLSLHPGYCDAESYSATIGVSDGALTAQQTFAITVTDVPRAPVWSSGGAYTASLPEGGSTTVAVSTTDPDAACGAAPAALSLVSSTAGSALALQLTDHGDGTGSLAVTAAAVSAGSYQVTLRATDSVAPTLTVNATVSVTVSHVNRPPVANAGGPYTGVAGTPVAMSGAASSDPDGDPLTYAWAFGDGATGVGVGVSHAYAATGAYGVTLTVSDGSLTGSASATATIAPALQARAWAEPSEIHFYRGKPTVRVYLEPVSGSFDASLVLLGSITLSCEQGAGAVGAVQPLTAKPGASQVWTGGTGTEGGRVRVDFSKDAVRGMLSFVTAPTVVNLTIRASLASGATVSATFPVHVVPEKRHAIRQVGPNPLNPEAVVTLDVSVTGPVRLRVYDLNGRLVRTLLDGQGVAGQTIEVRFDGRADSGRRLASGQYFLRSEMADGTESAGVTILK